MEQTTLFIDSDDPYKVLFEHSTDAFLVIEGNAFIDCNQAALDMLGYDKKEDIYNLHPSEISPEYQPDGQLSKVKAALILKTAFENGNHRFEWDHMRNNGEVFPVEVLLTVIPFEGKKLLHVVWRDISERKEKEEQLRRSQKLEALGTLTGGIAHDYNNMLNIIRGYAELLTDGMSHDSKMHEYAQKIVNASERGANLTRKLLAFTKQKTAEIKPLDINMFLQEQRLLLEKILTSKISLHYELEDRIWIVDLDRRDLEDAIINFSINAEHAMESGGQLSIRTTNEHLNERDAKAFDIPSGDYVMLSIADTGCGMDRETKERIFDPFFTTKGDKGTGLGLSQIHGFIERCGGKIKVFSELGHGTRFTVYFPRSQKKAELSLVPGKLEKSDLKGTETVLVVDDEPAIVELTNEILSAQGYSVFMVNSADQALTVLEKQSIDLLVTDVVMPHMNGYQLAAQVQNLFPDVKILIVSGFEDDHHKIMADDALRQRIIYKPYTSYNLLAHVRKLLDENKSAHKHAKSTILIMDDEADIRELFTLNLDKLGYQTLPACNGDEAISLYQQSLVSGETIDAVILDLSIPYGLEGKEVAAKIRSLDPHANIIVASGHSDGQEMKHYQDYGFDGALEKTFDREKMKQVLEKVLLLS